MPDGAALDSRGPDTICCQAVSAAVGSDVGFSVGVRSQLGLQARLPPAAANCQAGKACAACKAPDGSGHCFADYCILLHQWAMEESLSQAQSLQKTSRRDCFPVA